MPDWLKHLFGLEQRSAFLRSYMERGNVEVMRAISPLLVLVGGLGFASTFLELEFWTSSLDVVGAHRAFFVLLAALGLVFGLVSRRLSSSSRRRAGERGVATLVAALLAACVWITLVTYPYMHRYFYLLSGLIVVYGLFFVPLPVACAVMVAVDAAVFAGLTWQGQMDSVQGITLLTYCFFLVVVSSASYKSRLRSGIASEEIRNSARHDELTHARNRRALDEDVTGLAGKPLYVIISDIDEFKSYNDLYGHELGDRMLQVYADAMFEAFGRDCVYRYGGDEFVAVVPDCPRDELDRKIARWRERFHGLVVDGSAYQPTCSVGCVSAAPASASSFFDVLLVTDMLLYRAKEEGRNRVEHAEYSDALLAMAMSKSTVRHFGDYALDSLTGLPGSDYFYEHAAVLLPSYLRHTNEVDFVYFNVSDLKGYNERNGYEAGDELLRFVASTIRDTFPNRMLARFGDDRFVLLTEDSGLKEALDSIHAAVLGFRENQLTSVRAGVMRYTNPELEIRTAVDRAKLACDSARGQFSVTYRYYTEELGREAARRKRVLERFDAALGAGYIQVHYQPIVRSVSDLICEFEALVRWDDPEEGLMAPADFIPALEEARLIHLLDLHVVEQACQHLRCVAETRPPCPVSVNLSRFDFETGDMVAEVGKLLARYEVPPELLRVEIGEDAFMSDPETIYRAVRRFHELGAQVWMDDFGNGRSSLNVLREYEFDAVKIDMSFLRGLDDPARAKRSQVMFTHVVGLGKELGLQTIAEGVETLEQMLFLRSIGCDKMQGFVFSAAVPFERLVENVEANVFYLEETWRRSYFDVVGRVNLMKPFDTSREPDLTGVGDGLPVAVLEWDGQLLHYILTSGPFLKNLAAEGFGDVVEAEIRLNDPTLPTDPLRARVEEIVAAQGWVRLDYGKRRVGFARLLAAEEHAGVTAILYVAPVIPSNAAQDGEALGGGGGVE